MYKLYSSPILYCIVFHILSGVSTFSFNISDFLNRDRVGVSIVFNFIYCA